MTMSCLDCGNEVANQYRFWPRLRKPKAAALRRTGSIRDAEAAGHPDARHAVIARGSISCANRFSCCVRSACSRGS